ncbi:MAG: DUF763 domain-containing protein [Candidatus Micrarchaeaceae archaeon]
MQNLTLLPLHGGKAPRWLFHRMVRLSGLVSEAIIDEYGTSGFIDRLSDPQWFQALSCVIGYDWHSSGTTTVTVGALKEALNGNSDIYIAGGKGKQGTATPEQITEGADSMSVPDAVETFKDYSKMAAKIDSALIYDDIGIYHHAFIFSKNREWAVVQQAMHAKQRMAIRFQINGKKINTNDITNETNSAIDSELRSQTMDLTFEKNKDAKQMSLALVNEDISKIESVYRLPRRHDIITEDLSPRAMKLLKEANELQPESYEELMRIKGLGRKTLRSLAIISSLLYNNEIYKRDPIMYSYNLGGKDGIPYRINTQDYDNVVSSMSDIVKSIKLQPREQDNILRSLNRRVSMAYSK